MEKINIITGGNGYIGSHTALEFLRRGKKVLIIDDLSNSFEETYISMYRDFGDLVDFLECDVRDYSQIINYVMEYDIDSIIHFAALKSVPESMEIPLDYMDVNLCGLISILRVVEKTKPNSFIFSSSCAVYGDIGINPVTEESDTDKQESIYALSKKLGEDIILGYSGRNGNNTTFYILRYFNPIGSDHELKIGENPRKDNFNVAGHLLKCESDSLSFKIYGNDYLTPDGTCIRDYINITDLANSHYVCAISKGPNRINTYNVGTGIGNSVLSLISSFNEVTGKDPIRVEISGRRDGDTESVWADSSKIEKELGWKASRGIIDSLRSAYLYRSKK